MDYKNKKTTGTNDTRSIPSMKPGCYPASSSAADAVGQPGANDSNAKDRMAREQRLGLMPSHVAEMRERRKLEKVAKDQKVVQMDDNHMPTVKARGSWAIPDAPTGGRGLAHTQRALEGKQQAFGNSASAASGRVVGAQKKIGIVETSEANPPTQKRGFQRGLQRTQEERKAKRNNARKHQATSSPIVKGGLRRQVPEERTQTTFSPPQNRKGLRGRQPPRSRNIEEEKQEEDVESVFDGDVRHTNSYHSTAGTQIMEDENLHSSIPAHEDGRTLNSGPSPSRVQEPQLVEDTVDSNHRLVEARAVFESEMNLSLPQAQEVDLDESAKKNDQRRKTRRRYQQGGLFLVGVLVLVLVVVVVTTRLGSDDENEGDHLEDLRSDGTMPNFAAAPTSPPSVASNSSFLEIEELPPYTIDAIAVTGSPQQRAYEWTFNHPDFNEPMENWRKKQLLALATFFYSLDGDNWKDKKNWMDPNTNECYWYSGGNDVANYRCMGYACGSPTKYLYSGNLCLSSSTAIGEEHYPNGTNCNEDGKFNLLNLANGVAGVLHGAIPLELFFLTSLTTINLGEGYRGNDITGTLPSEVGILSNLTMLDLSGNRLQGGIPSTVGMLSSLETIDLSGNNLTGSIPSEIGMTNLTDRGGLNNGALALHNNFLTGSIPSELGLLTYLKQINLQENQLKGAIPSQVGNLLELNWLEVQSNSLSLLIPSELGRLANLRFLDLSENLITGSIPSEVGLTQVHPNWEMELFGISMVDLSGNLLTGTVPAPFLLGNQIHLQNNQLVGISSDIGSLPSPRRLLLDLGDNFLSSLPSELFLLTTLQRLRLTGNQLTHLPSEVAQMGPNNDLEPWQTYAYCHLDMDLSHNLLEAIPHELPYMYDFIHWIFGNNIIKELPSLDWSNLSHIETVSLPQNRLQRFPTEVLQLPNLDTLDLSSNYMSGGIPTYEKACKKTIFQHHSSCTTSLLHLNLFNNSLNGSIPIDLGSFSRLETVNLSSNLLTGSIPTSFFSLSKLQSLDLSNNQLSNNIPAEIGLNFNASTNTTSLYSLILRNNSLTSSIPSEVGVLDYLEILDFSSNSLTGGIPSELGNIYGVRSYRDYSYSPSIEHVLDWTYLNTLNLSHNALSGSIPTELGALTNLQVLDLSFNSLTGAIPSELGLINATQITGKDRWMWKNNHYTVPATTKIVLLGNNFSGSLPEELCDWYCDGQRCSINECNASASGSVLYVDCSPSSSLDCSACAC